MIDLNLEIIGAKCDRLKGLNLLLGELCDHAYTVENVLCYGEPEFVENRLSLFFGRHAVLFAPSVGFNFTKRIWLKRIWLKRIWLKRHLNNTHDTLYNRKWLQNKIWNAIH